MELELIERKERKEEPTKKELILDRLAKGQDKATIVKELHTTRRYVDQVITDTGIEVVASGEPSL